jgi:hypothetical protein
VIRIRRATTWLSAALLACCGCECPGEVSTVADGGSINGVVPSESVAPFVGDHQGELLWTIPQQSTTVHLVIERSGPIEAYEDCNGKLGDIEVGFTASLYTDDGILSLSEPTGLELDSSGNAPDESLPWNPDFDQLHARGVTPPGLVGGGDIELSIPIVNLKPMSTTMQWVDGDPHPVLPSVTMAVLTFPP